MPMRQAVLQPAVQLDGPAAGRRACASGMCRPRQFCMRWRSWCCECRRRQGGWRWRGARACHWCGGRGGRDCWRGLRSLVAAHVAPLPPPPPSQNAHDRTCERFHRRLHECTARVARAMWEACSQTLLAWTALLASASSPSAAWCLRRRPGARCVLSTPHSWACPPAVASCCTGECREGEGWGVSVLLLIWFP